MDDETGLEDAASNTGLEDAASSTGLEDAADQPEEKEVKPAAVVEEPQAKPQEPPVEVDAKASDEPAKPTSPARVLASAGAKGMRPPSNNFGFFLDSSVSSDRLRTHASVVNYLRSSMDYDFPRAIGQCTEWSNGIRRVASAPAFPPPPEIPYQCLAPNPRGPSSAAVVAARRRAADMVTEMRPFSTLSSEYGSPKNLRRRPPFALDVSQQSAMTESRISLSPTSGRTSPTSPMSSSRGLRAVYTGKGSVRVGPLHQTKDRTLA